MIWTSTNQIQDAEVLNLLEKETAGKFAPGSQWSYSNSSYVVLGLVVAKISGKTFREFLGERIFTPLKMSQTLAFEKGKNEVSQRAYGHSKEDNAWKETDQSPTRRCLLSNDRRRVATPRSFLFQTQERGVATRLRSFERRQRLEGNRPESDLRHLGRW